MYFSYTAAAENSKMRLDAYLCMQLSDCTRSHIRKLIDKGLVTVNEKTTKAGYSLNTGDIISVTMPELKAASAAAEDIPLDIVYEDNDVIIVNKPDGMVVHPAAGHYEGTLVNALMHHCADSLSGINGELRPGIVHRIDKDTTGLLIACKNDTAHNSIAAQLKEHSITRRYLAIVYGTFREDSGRIDKPIARSKSDRKKYAVSNDPNAKNAVTNYRVLERFDGYSLVECRLETGRTHQIRVHMSSIGHPLLGDEIYGCKNDRFRGHGQFLHAAVLGFIHPVTGEYMEFSADVPDYFDDTLDILRNRK